MYHHKAAQGAQEGNRFGGFRQQCGGFNAQRFGRHMPHWMQKFAGNGTNNVPVNIEENDEAFTMSVYAAGLVKERFTVSVKDDVLSIAYKADSQSEQAGYTHQEFVADSFERLFQLHTKVLVDNITATYTDGVLKVTLPKNPETAAPAQKVDIQ